MLIFAPAILAAALSLNLQNADAPAAAQASRELLSGLSASDGAARARAYELLKKAGPGEIVKFIPDFESLPPIARELFAKLLREAGDVSGVDAVRACLKDNNPLVRVEFANYLSRPDFAFAKAPERAAQLLIMARDAEFPVREIAFRGLLRLAEPSAIDGLVNLFKEGDATQRDRALRALGSTPAAAPALVSLQSWMQNAGASDRVLWLLALGLTGDISVLPELLKYAKHPTEGDAASTGFDLLVQRLIFRRRDSELLQALDAWRAVDPLDVAWRRLRYELLVKCDLGAAREAARALDAAAANEGARKLEWRAAAAAAEAICLIADGDGAAAEERLSVAFAHADGRRLAGADNEDDETLAMLAARVRVLSAFNAIVNKFPGAPQPAARLEEAYKYFRERVYQATIRSLQGLYHRTRKDDLQFQQLLNQLLSGRPWGLSANWNFDPALETELGALTVISTVMPKRGRGAAGLAAGVEILNLLSDINPREFVTSRHSDDWQNARSGFENLNAGRVVSIPVSPVRVAIEMSVSSFTRDLGQVARSILGDMKTAAELLEPVIRRAALGTQISDLSTFVDASLERAGVAMDAQQPEVADEYIITVMSRLDEVRKTHEAEFDAESVKLLGAAVAEARTAQSKMWLEAERRLRAQTLISRAVNENVVKGHPEVAARFAKEGVALDPSEFNKVVLACYLAREGNATEARAILRDASDSPGTYYNLACTYALLGEADNSLIYLERDFQEHADKGGLERQRAWARKDPDLKLLRSDPRFLQLVQPEAAASRPSGTSR